MGTIPAPNIAEIAGQTAQIAPNVAAQYALEQERAQQMRQSAQAFPLEQQERQQQITAADTQNQAAQMALREQQAMRSTAPQYVTKDQDGKPTGFDTEGYYNDLLGQGVNPATVAAQRQAQVNYQKSMVGLTADQLKLHNDMNDQAYELIEPLREHAADPKADINDINGSWQGIAPRLVSLGMNPKELPASFASPADMKAKLDNFIAELGQHKQMLTDAKTQADTAKENAEAEEKKWQKFPELGLLYNTNTGETRSVTGGAPIMTPAMMESKYVGLQQKKNSGQPLSADDAAWAKGYEKYKELVPQFNVNMATTGGGLAPNANTPAVNPKATPQTAPGGWLSSSGKTLNDVPANIRGEVQQVLEYRRADPSITQRGPVGQAINSWVAELDPQHDATTFGAKNKILNEYVKDASTGELGAINTGLGHLGDLYTASQALSQNNLPLLHSIASKFGLATGGTAEAVYTAILHKVGPELTKAYLKSGGTEGERGSNEDDFALSKGQAQIQNNIFESANLLNSKLASKRNDWEKTFLPYRDQDHFDNRFVTPEARQMLTQLGSQSTVAKANAGAGGNHIINIGTKRYQYKGSGDTADLTNYTELPPKK